MRAILTYHSIDRSGSVISLDEEAFADHVRWLTSGRARVTTVPELLALPPSEDAVALTFDDGFANFATAAWPRLQDHGLPATVFIVTDHVGGTNAWERRGTKGLPELPLLDWETLGRLLEGGVAVEVHTRSHPDLRVVSPSRLGEEIDGAFEMLRARLGRRPEGFCYPYGSVNDLVRARVASVASWASTTEFRSLPQTPDPWRLPRLDTFYFRRAPSLAGWGSPSFLRRLWFVRQGRSLRRSLAGNP